MNRTFTFIAKDEITAENLIRLNGISRRMLVKLKRTENGITKNGEHCRSCDVLKKGDVLVLTLPCDKKAEEPNSSLEVDVVYEDEDIVVYNKPANMPVHPSIHHRGDTLGNFFSSCYPSLTFRPVNRLDRDTSGLCLCAKNAVSANIPQGSIKKTYYAVVEGIIKDSGRINLPIARESESIIKRVVRIDGKEAITEYTPIAYGENHTLVEINLLTGRTHQIRVHFSHIGHALAGDTLYGGKDDIIQGQALHCGKMEIVHPITKEKIFFQAEMPKAFELFIK